MNETSKPDTLVINAGSQNSDEPGILIHTEAMDILIHNKALYDAYMISKRLDATISAYEEHLKTYKADDAAVYRIMINDAKAILTILKCVRSGEFEEV